MTQNRVGWIVAYWTLFAGWILGVGLTMAHVRVEFLTSYLADLLFPPWFYIVLRRLTPQKRRLSIMIRWFGQSPERAVVSIFLVGVTSELSSRYWPRGAFPGTYDPLDIVAYAAGLGVCYSCEQWQRIRSK
jgi:hypothetical protein